MLNFFIINHPFNFSNANITAVVIPYANITAVVIPLLIEYIKIYESVVLYKEVIMLERALTLRKIESKLTAKMIVSISLIILAVVLPQAAAHLVGGEMAGVTLLPMYLPVLIGGCVLGSKWAAIVGIASPVVSFIITSAMGSPMPAAARLPFMMAELAVFAIVSGLFTQKILKNSLWSFAAVILAGIAGRLSFLALVFLFQSFVPFNVPMIWGQIQKGFLGLGIQVVVVPVIAIIIKKYLCEENE